MSKLSHSNDETMEAIEGQPVPDESGMQEAKHTPGPWHINAVRCEGDNVFAGNRRICNVYGDIGQDPFKANARLIAAAPELLEALKLYHRGWTHGDGNIDTMEIMAEASEKARAAIAKATAE